MHHHNNSNRQAIRTPHGIEPMQSKAWKKLPVLLCSLGLSMFLGILPSAFAASAPPLGGAQGFAVLGSSTVTNTGPSIVTGDIGVSPGSSITGFPPGTVIGGIHANDVTASTGQGDVTTAYNNLAGQACTTNLTGQDLGALTLTPGVYCFDTSAQLTGTLTLDAQGDSNAIFIFQIGSTLTAASNSVVTEINSAQSCNIFWQVGSSATIGTNSAFQGDILAQASITMNTGASLGGRALARSGAVTLDMNAVTSSTCSTPATTITIASVSNGGVGTFSYVGNNGFANQNITTVTSGIGVTGSAQTLAASGMSTTITESATPAGLSVNAISCSGLSAGGSATPDIAAQSITLDAAATAAGAAIACTFTNALTAPIPANAAGVPTLSHWSLVILSGLVALFIFVTLRRRHA